MNEIRHGFHTRDLIVGPKTRAVRADAAIGLNSGSFDENKGGAFKSIVAQCADVVGGQSADVRSGFCSAVLAHWRDDCPVAKRSTTDV